MECRMMLNSNPTARGALLAAGDVAKTLALSVRSVRRLIASGELPSVRLGRAVRVRQIDVDALIGRQWRGGGL